MSPDLYRAIAVWSDVLSALVFIVFLIWLWVKMVTPAVIAARDRKNAELLDAERRRDAARDDAVAAQAALEAASGDVAGIGARAERDAAAVAAKLVGEARAEGERLVRNAGGELERGRAAARERLRDELIAKALEIARGGAGKLDATTDARLVGGAVEALESEAR